MYLPQNEHILLPSIILFFWIFTSCKLLTIPQSMLSFCCCWSIHFCALPYLISFLWLAIFLAFYLLIEYFTQSLWFSFVLLHSCMLFMSCLILFLSSFWVHYFFQYLYLFCYLCYPTSFLPLLSSFIRITNDEIYVLILLLFLILKGC